MVRKWEDVTLGMYIEIIDVMKDSDPEESDGSLEIISVILDKSLDDVREMDYDDYLKVVNRIKFMNEPIPSNVSNTITLSGVTMELLPFNQLEFGAFIDIEHYFADKNNYTHNLPKIFSILYRQVVTPSDTLNNATYEPYGDWLDIRGSLFEKVPVTAVYGLVTQYMNFRSKIYKNYEGLFQEKEEALSEEDELEITKGMTSKEREGYEHEKAVGNYGWDLFLLRLANNDPLKMMEATKLPIIFALNILGMQNTLRMS